MKDKYFYPSTVSKCHERIEGMLHTNKTQAEDIHTLQSRLHGEDLKNAKLNAQLLISRTAHNNLVADWKALKGLLAMLSRDDVTEFMPIEEWNEKNEVKF